MSAIVPPSAPPLPSGAGGGAVVALQILTDAKVLDGMAAGVLLDAVAQSRAAKGLLEVMTAAGPVQLKALPGQVMPAIPDGAKLLMQLVGQGADAQLRLLSVNGRQLAGAAALMAGLAAPHAAGQPGTPNPAGAIGLPPPPQPGGMASGMPVSAPGQTAQPLGLVATLIRPAATPGQAPTPGQPSASGQPAPGQSAPSVPAQPAGPAPGAAGLPADLPAGTTLKVRIAGIVPPSAGGGQPAAAPPGGVPAQPQSASPLPGQAAAPPSLTGTVAAHPPGGQAVVRTPIGTLSLPVQGELPAGTAIRLEVVGPPQPPATPPAAAASRPEGLTAAGWPALTDAIETLAATDKQALEQLLRSLPQAGPRLAASLSLFALAQRSGDKGAVLGDTTVKALDKAGRRDVAHRLEKDLDELSGESARPLGGGEWRGYTLPFVNGGVVDPIRLYVRGGGDNEKRQAGGTGNDQRFVLDFSLSVLGRLQLDGLVRREEKLFDLILRTGDPLPEAMRRDIMGIFTEASELAGTKGTIAFQSGGRWVEPLPDQGATSIEA